MSRKRKPKAKATPARPEEKAASTDRRRSAAAGLGPPGEWRLVLGICAILVLAVAVVFCQTVTHKFVNYDDNEYVYDNSWVTGGPTADNLAAAFAQSRAGNWHPLTWLSHAWDWRLHGRWAGGHHLTSVLLHAATTVVLFLALRRMTGALWPSAFVAAVFAVHPLHVESVAWVAERKDTLSGLFFALTLAAYTFYVAKPYSWGRFAVVVAFYGLGIMSKPMLVTLPFVLLLLDYWPLGRMRVVGIWESGGSGKGQKGRFSFPARLVWEKTPLFALAAASCVATVLAQQKAILPGDRLPFSWRVGNAAVSYVAYVGQMFYPAGLAPLYPHPGGNLPAWQMIAASLILAGITAAVVIWRRRFPFLLVGWLWYAGMLVPVIGLVQVGDQARADRYTYLTQIGLYVATAWLLAYVCRAWRYGRWACSLGAVLALATLTACAWRQTSFWRNSESLWTHTLACGYESAAAHNNLGSALDDRREFDEATAHYRRALEMKSDYVEAHTNLANALVRRGELDKAIAHHRKALEIDPHYAQACNNLGNALACRGEVEAAIIQYRRALEIRPEYALAHNNLGVALAGRGETAEAISHYRKALAIRPDYVEARCNLGNALADRGELDAAIAQYRQALEIKPDYAEAHNLLGATLACQGQVDEAIGHYRRALKLKPDYPELLNNLGVALASQGQVGEAIDHYRAAVRINPKYATASLNLGNALVAQGRSREAVDHWRQSLRATPDAPLVLDALAWALATSPEASLRDGSEAIELAQRAIKLTGGKVPEMLDTLAAAYAEFRNFSAAVKAAQEAIAVAGQQKNTALAEAIQKRIKLYQAGLPFREAAPRSQ